jgi:hypothetical protein
MQQLQPMSTPVVRTIGDLDRSRFSVRDGRLAPVTCVACGCRLEQRAGLDGWFHFRGKAGRDARGCIVACADDAHYASELPALA